MRFVDPFHFSEQRFVAATNQPVDRVWVVDGGLSTVSGSERSEGGELTRICRARKAAESKRNEFNATPTKPGMLLVISRSRFLWWVLSYTPAICFI
jgi:hypothetical protein